MPLFEEVASLLVAAGVGTLNTNIFGSSARNIPDGDGPYLSIIETGGTTPLRIHNAVASGVVVATEGYERPSFQIVVRARTFSEARLMARRAYKALRIRNRLVGTSALTLTSLTRSGATATATCPTAHGWVTDQQITIAGAAQSDYNGAHIITVTSTTVFTFTVSGSPVTPATGTVTATFPGTWYCEIEANQEPFDLGLDVTGRPRVAFNMRALKGPS